MLDLIHLCVCVCLLTCICRLVHVLVHAETKLACNMCLCIDTYIHMWIYMIHAYTPAYVRTKEYTNIHM